MIENRVQEEVLYREALAMGLDKDDTIVKRRMAQKMQFLAEDVAAAHQPSMSELKSWFEKNSGKFTMSNRASASAICILPLTGEVRARRQDAATALSKLAGQPVDSKLAASLADRFMFQDYYGDKTRRAASQGVRPAISPMAVVQLKPGSWQGPVESGYGWHLILSIR